jgi:hypothetical protein
MHLRIILMNNDESPLPWLSCDASIISWAVTALQSMSVSSLQTEFAKEFALRPAISFPKGMRRVQFAEKVGGPVSKGVDIETDEMVFSRQLHQYLLERGF